MGEETNQLVEPGVSVNTEPLPEAVGEVITRILFLSRTVG